MHTAWHARCSMAPVDFHFTPLVVVIIVWRVAAGPHLPAASDAVSRARRELEAAAMNLARQKQLYEQGEPERDVDLAQAKFDAKARALEKLERR
jgi:hypothetical protein